MSVDKLKRTVLGLIAVSLFFVSGVVLAEYPLNLTEGVTPTSQKVYDLHMTIFYIVTVIGIAVFAVMTWSIFHHRKSKGAVPAQFHHSTFAEITWTIIPILILVGMAIPATKTLVFMEQTGDAEMTLKVTGYQWKWKYDYLDEDISFFSSLAAADNEARQLNSGIDPSTIENYLKNVDNPIVLPVDTKIRILTTAADVIHSWWVPDLGWKRDAIPGYINDNWTYIEEPGVYRGKCTELCGKDHGFMPIVVHAVSKEDYVTWVAEKKAEQAAASSGKDMTMAELMEKGKTVYGTNCAACHMPNGEGGAAFPALAGSAIATGDVANHVDIVVNGSKNNPMMQAFGQQLNDADLAAVITYERNAWGNDTGDMVQPSDVKAARK
ncbi:MAG: cytochrome c oxidase subunit II [Proteobacteria bacterium]|nr:cytochrome c oxidase subunit II [Pseudomonadota bacterium]NOG60688.1 cytochrome c oxidase subunit II [Pseudomonadota bacterium]